MLARFRSTYGLRPHVGERLVCGTWPPARLVVKPDDGLHGADSSEPAPSEHTQGDCQSRSVSWVCPLVRSADNRKSLIVLVPG